MDALATIIGLGLASFLLFFFSSQLEEKHGLLKLLTLFFVLSFLILIPKVIIDNEETCEVVLNDTEEIVFFSTHGSHVVANHTDVSYNYTSYCFTQENNTNSTFFSGVLWFYRLFILYVFIYLGYEGLMALNNSYKSRGRK